MPGKLSQNKGFTLIELMVAAIVMAITGLVLYYMFNQGQTLMMEQEHRQTVFEAAQKRMAVYKLLSDQELITPGTFRGTQCIEVEPANPDIGAPAVSVSANWVTKIDRGLDLYSVQVRYTWDELSGREYEVTLKSNFFINPTGGS